MKTNTAKRAKRGVKNRRGVRLKKRFDWRGVFARIFKQVKLLTFVGFFLGILAGPFYIWHYIHPENSLFSINRVHLSWDKVEYLDIEEMSSVISAALKEKNFFTINVSALQNKLSKNPWIGEVNVKRKWFNELEVTFSEKKPVARWNSSLITRDGIIFTPQESLDLDFFTIYSETDNKEALVKKALAIRETLETHNLHLEALRYDNRQAWTLWLKEGVTLYFGAKDFDDKFALFLEKYPEQLADDFDRISTINFHYNNRSFAITYKEIEETNELKE